MLHVLLFTIILFCYPSENITATSIEIINDTNYNFLISDHQKQAIMIPSQQSCNFNLEQNKALYFYFSEKNNFFKLICTIKEKLISQELIQLHLNDIVTHNFAAYPHLFFIPNSYNTSPAEKQSSQQTNSFLAPMVCPTTEKDTLSLLLSIKQQQQIARESFQENVLVKPTTKKQINNKAPNADNIVQKINTIAASRSQNNHQFAQSSRRN